MDAEDNILVLQWRRKVLAAVSIFQTAVAPIDPVKRHLEVIDSGII